MPVSKLTGKMKLIARYMDRFKTRLLQDDPRLAGYDLGSRQAEALLTLSRMPDASQDDLADVLMINKSNVARRLELLESKGLVCRAANPDDRRAARVRLTPEGEAILPVLWEVNRKWSEFVSQDLTPEEEARLEEILGAIVQRVEEFLKGGGAP